MVMDFVISILAFALNIQVTQGQNCAGYTAAVPLVQSVYNVWYSNPYINFQPWVSQSPSGQKTTTTCQFTSYVATQAPSSTPPVADTSGSIKTGRASQLPDGTWQLEVKMPAAPQAQTQQYEFYLTGVIELNGAQTIQSTSPLITLNIFSDDNLQNPCLSSPAFSTNYLYGIETGFPLNTNIPATDNDAGIVAIVLSQTVQITTTQSSCPIVNVAVVSAEPTGQHPYTESTLAILENSAPGVVLFEWNLYVPKCQQLYMYGVQPSGFKGGTTAVKLCTCGLETIEPLTTNTLRLLYRIGSPTSYKWATEADLKGLFTVDLSQTVTDCGIVSLSLQNDTNGTPFLSQFSNNYISLNSNNELIMPTYAPFDWVVFYVKAVTNGNKIAYKKIQVKVTLCGSEELESNFPYYYNITLPYQSGLWKSPVLGANFLAELFESDVSYEACPIDTFQLQPYSDTDFLARNRGHRVYQETAYGPDLSTQVYLTRGNYIEVDTNSFTASGTFFFDLAVETVGGFVAITSFQLIITDPPKSVNLPPNYASPPKNVILDAASTSAYQYISPIAFDPENDNISVKIHLEKLPSCGKQCFYATSYSTLFVLTIQRGALQHGDSGTYPIKITLSDNVSPLTTTTVFNITLIVPDAASRIPGTQTEIYKAFEGERPPQFYELKQSLNGANAYNVYNTTLSGGLHDRLTFSNFPNPTSSTTSTNVTAVLLATYPVNTALGAAAAQAGAAVAVATAQAAASAQAPATNHVAKNSEAGAQRVQGQVESAAKRTAETFQAGSQSPTQQSGSSGQSRQSNVRQAATQGAAEVTQRLGERSSTQGSATPGASSTQQSSGPGESGKTPKGAGAAQVQSDAQRVEAAGSKSQSGANSGASAGGATEGSKQPSQQQSAARSTSPGSGPGSSSSSQSPKSTSPSPQQSQTKAGQSPAQGPQSYAQTAAQTHQKQDVEDSIGQILDETRKSKVDTILPPKIDSNTVMNQEGVIDFQFDQKMEVPKFVPQALNRSRNNRRLLTVEGRNDTCDYTADNFTISDVVYVILSIPQYDSVNFTMQLLNWTDRDLKLKINFTNPNQIQSNQNKAQFVIKNRACFKAASSGFALSEKDSIQLRHIPPQLGKGENYKKEQRKAQRVKDAVTVIAIVQLVLQVFLKGVIEDLWALYFTLQLTSYLTLLNVSFPATTTIYIQQFRGLVDFDVLKPDYILPKINEKWSVAYFVGIGKQQVQGNLALTGITNGSIVYNLQTYILFLVVFLIFMLLLAVFAIIKKFRARIQTLITNIIKKTFFNNLVRSINLSYLKSALAFVVALELFLKTDEGALSKDGAVVFLPIVSLGIIPIICFIAIYVLQDRLEQQAVKDRIEKMYLDVNLKRNSWAKYIYPVFLIRRFLFVLIPIAFPQSMTLQLQAFSFLSLFHAMYYFGAAPHFAMKKLLMEGFNDTMIILLGFHLYCFTDFVNPELRTDIGLSFTAVFMIICLANLIFMMNNVFYRIKSKRRKKRYQKAYEARFAAFQARIKCEREEKSRFNMLKTHTKAEIQQKYNSQILELQRRTRLGVAKLGQKWSKHNLESIKEEPDGNSSLAESQNKSTENVQIKIQDQTALRPVDEATLLSPQMSQDIKDLEIETSQNQAPEVRVENVFDKQLVNNVGVEVLEVAILLEQKVRLLQLMKEEIEQKKAKCEQSKKERDYQIEFLEINYKYLETISNNVLKKARRKISKKHQRRLSAEQGGLLFEYEVTCTAIGMEATIIRREQRRLLESEANWELYERDVAKIDVLNNCNEVKDSMVRFKSIYEESLESSGEDEVDQDEQDQIRTKASFGTAPAGQAISDSPAEVASPDDSGVIQERQVISKLLNKFKTMTKDEEEGQPGNEPENKHKQKKSKDSNVEAGEQDVFAEAASLGIAAGALSLATQKIAPLLEHNDDHHEGESASSEGSAPEVFENVADEVQAIVTDVVTGTTLN